VMFIHTGGAAALFGYDGAFDMAAQWTGTSAAVA
jgi:hypothetical protein